MTHIILTIFCALVIFYIGRKSCRGNLKNKYPPPIPMTSQRNQTEIQMTEMTKNDSPRKIVKDPTKVLIVARWHSGSTFAGDLFNKNPKAFYIFEPLCTEKFPHGISYNQTIANSDTIVPEYQQILTDYYNHCRIPIYSLSKFVALNDKIKKSGIIPLNVMASGKIPDSKMDKLTEFCESHEIRVTKTIRLKSLEHLPENLSKDLKIIYLVRDPRAIVKSRITRNDIWDLNKGSRPSNTKKRFDRLDHVCETYDVFLNQRKNYKFAENILVVRYEDLTYERVKMAEKIYQFIGEKERSNFDEKLAHRFEHNARASIRISKGWRGVLDFSVVDRVQKGCDKVFEAFGYEKVLDDQEYEKLRNESSWVLNPGCVDCDW